MEDRKVEWSFGKDHDLIIDVWSTAALIEAVINALLAEPDKLVLALDVLQKSRPS